MKIIIIISIIFLSGCGMFDRAWVTYTGDASEICKNGVIYYQFTSGSTVAYEPSGKIKTCK